MFSHLATILLVALSGQPQTQHQVGERLFLIEDTPVTEGQRIVAALDCGNPLIVEDVQGSQLLVNTSPPGWIPSKAALPLESALDYFHQKLSTNANQPKFWYALGRCLAEQKEFAKARQCYDKAVSLKPNTGAYFLARGLLNLEEGQQSAAVDDFTRAATLEPTNAHSYRWRAAAYIAQGDYEKALADYNEAVRRDPGNSCVINDRAWMLSTCPDERFRNGEQAVADAWLAASRSNWKRYNRIATLAAAYAESGDFEQAVRWQQLAIATAPEDHAANLEATLRLYEAQRPYREMPIQKR